jgi:outer membrane protein TolC
MFDFLTSTKRPASGTPVLPAQQVLERLMALNRPTAPWSIVDGKAENVDLIAEWKIVDAQWYEIFAKAGLSKVFRIYLKLDDAEKQVRAQDHEYEVSWSAGVPTLSLAASSFKGQSKSFELGASYGFTENLTIGQQYKYSFKTDEIKKPIQEAVIACGWVYKGVAFGKL